jgi:hypothetical protein
MDTMNNPLTREFARKLVKLHGFADLVETTLVERAEALDADLSAKASSFPEDQRQEFYEYHAEDYLELADELPTILRYSVLTAADSAFEVYLNDTCETYAEVHRARVRLGDFKGAGIQRARKYLKKVAGVVFPDDKPSWTTVMRLHDLRNCIVHADGVVSPSRNDLHQSAESIGGLRLTNGGTISLGRTFTEGALNSYEKFATEFDGRLEGLGLWQSVFPIEEA